MASEDGVGIFFDEEFRIRVLDVDRVSSSKSLQLQCDKFIERVGQLQDTAGRYLSQIDLRAQGIEAEKLRAIGLRNQAAAAEEDNRRKRKELKQLLAEKHEELERLQVEEQSLLKLRQEQELTIAKLSDSSVGTDG